MRSSINGIYRRPYPIDFYNHFRNDLGLTDDHKKIMDSLRCHYADSQFHYDNTELPDTRFENMLKHMTDRHITELIRLAIIGWETEKQEEIRQKIN